MPSRAPAFPKLIGPPVYRPGQAAQTRPNTPPRPAPPPVYRPAPPPSTQRMTVASPAIPAPPKLIGPPVYRPNFAAQARPAAMQPAVRTEPRLIGPPVYRPAPPAGASVTRSLFTRPAAPAPRPIAPPVRPPAPPAPAPVLQRMQATATQHEPALTMAAANPVRSHTDQTTNLAASMGGHVYRFKSGNAEVYDQWKRVFPNRKDSGDEPHAEENFAGWLVSQKAAWLRGTGVKRISLSMDRSPCEPCAKLLVLLKDKYNLVIRLKATQCTGKTQKDGLQILKDAGIAFRFPNKAQLKTKYPDIKQNWQRYKRGEGTRKIKERTKKRYIGAYYKYKGKPKPGAKRKPKQPFGWQAELNYATGVFGYPVDQRWGERTPSLSWKARPATQTTNTTTTTTTTTNTTAANTNTPVKRARAASDPSEKPPGKKQKVIVIDVASSEEEESEQSETPQVAAPFTYSANDSDEEFGGEEEDESY